MVEIPDINVFRPGRTGPLPKLQPDAFTLNQVEKFSAFNLTQEEAAACLGVATSTFKKFLAQCEEARDRWELGTNHGKASVKRAQFVMAHRSAVMSIWWGKQNLGQTDKVEESVTQTVEHSFLAEGAAQFEARIRAMAERVAQNAIAAPATQH